MVVSSIELLTVTSTVELGRRRLIRKTVVMMGHALTSWRMDWGEI
jgi:hypothetical protein